MTASHSILSAKDKEKLRSQLYKTHGKKCHYCEIEEKEFNNIWEKKFYGVGKRGRRLEIDHKDGNKEDWNSENLVLACALCNMAKSDFLTYDEFKRAGKVIREIWQQKAVEKGIKI